jgi:hypothetical protein
MSKYTVINGDVIQSRKYNNISEILNKSLKKINYPDNMIIPFKISRGDEIQAVFKGALALPNLIRQIRYELINNDIRFGIIERALILTLVAFGSTSSIAVIFTAKSIARFKKFDNKKHFVEYYLLGTFCSIFIALIGGLFLRNFFRNNSPYLR